MFKDQLKDIFGRAEWPEFDELAAQLHVFAEQTEKVNRIVKDNSGGVISANISSETTKDKKTGFIAGCWNCGSKRHVKRDCREPPHRCEICGYIHLEKYCRESNKDTDSQDGQRKKSGEDKTRSPVKQEDARNNARPRQDMRSKSKKKISTKTRMIRKVPHARGMTAEDEDPEDDDEAYEEYEDDDRYHERNYTDEDYEEYEEYVCACGQMDEGAMAAAVSTNSSDWIIDSGCVGAHVGSDVAACDTIRYLTDSETQPSPRWWGSQIKD
jgi:hypothetical protein